MSLSTCPIGHRAACLAAVLAIAVLSLLPAQDMYRTGAPKGVEHFLAYCITGALFAMACSGRIRRCAAAVAMLVALAACMEVLQALSPGRTPDLHDFMAGSAGAVAGIPVGIAALRLITTQYMKKAAAT